MSKSKYMYKLLSLSITVNPFSTWSIFK